MPQLLFQLQQNGKIGEAPAIETLVHLMNQCSLKYDDINAEDDSLSVMFSNQDDARKAMDDLDGMLVMGSQLVIKPSEELEMNGRQQNLENENYGRQNRRYSPKYSRYNQNSYNSNYHPQPPKLDQYPCRLLIPSEMVKVVLGKGGSTITSIQSKTNTKIDVHRDKGTGRYRQSEDTLCSIKGEPEAFSEAIHELLLIMNTEYENSEQNEEEKSLQLKLLAHDLLCGRIIGKGGNNLKMVRQESGVTKLIISNSIYDEGSQFGPNGMIVSLGERVITIEGTVDAICAAEKIISQRLRDYMEKDMKNSNSAYNQNVGNGYYQGNMGNYGGNNNGYSQVQMMYPRSPYQQYPMSGYYYPYPNNYPGLLGQGYPPFTGLMPAPPQGMHAEEEICSISIPTKEVGAIIGRSGSYINKVKQYSYAQVRVVKGEEGEESRVEIKGPPDAQWRASLCVFGKIKETMKVPYSDAELKTEYMVPGSCVGRIIGKKGMVVQDIQDKAQTDIEVPKDKQGGDDVPVYITGTFNGTQIALNRIRDIVQRARSKPQTDEQS